MLSVARQRTRLLQARAMTLNAQVGVVWWQAVVRRQMLARHNASAARCRVRMRTARSALWQVDWLLEQEAREKIQHRL